MREEVAHEADVLAAMVLVEVPLEVVDGELVATLKLPVILTVHLDRVVRQVNES